MKIRALHFSLLICLPAVALADGTAGVSQSIGGLISSFKVATKQTEVMKDKQLIVRTQADQAASSAAIERHNREQVMSTMNNYGPQSGQMVDPCYQLSMADKTTEVQGKASSAATNAASRVYAVSDDGRINSGGLTGAFGSTKKFTEQPYAASIQKRNTRHLEKYCSVSEAKAGYCTLSPNGMQGADSDFSMHVAPGQTYGWDQTEAATDFVKTVAPVKPVPKASECNTAECLSAMRDRRQQEAYLSMARYSMLRFTESRTTQASGEAKKPATN